MTSHSQVLGTAYSFSLPSEPPDITNWFSSYAYESPVLNTDNDVDGSPFGGNDCVVEELDNEETGKEEENFEGIWKVRDKDELFPIRVALDEFVKHHTAEDHNHENENVQDSSDSLSLSSEPPDITKWFSSYVYESPALDTSNDFSGSAFVESECERAGLNTDNCSKDGEENLREFRRTTERCVSGADEKISSKAFVECNISLSDKYDHQYNKKDIHGVSYNKVSSLLNDLPAKMISGTVLKENHDSGSTLKLGLADEDFIGKKGGETDKRSLNPNGNSGRKKVLKKLTCGDTVEESPIQPENHGIMARASNLDSIVVNGQQIKKTTSGSLDKENDGKLDSGFISTRKEGSTGTKGNSSSKRSIVVQSDCLRYGEVASAIGKEAVTRRKPLSDTTNFQQTDASEITGKWKCPQRSKPNLGPPLKQLRLEQWVHRL